MVVVETFDVEDTVCPFDDVPTGGNVPDPTGANVSDATGVSALDGTGVG